MLYSTFCKLKIEAENEQDALASKQPGLVIDEDQFKATSYLTVGNLLSLQLEFKFFAAKTDDSIDFDSKHSLRPSFFKKLFLNVVEKSYTAHIMRNINFLLVQKYLADLLDEQLSESIVNKYAGSQIEAKTQLKLDKTVEPYKRIKFTLKKETDLFLAWN